MINGGLTERREAQQEETKLAISCFWGGGGGEQRKRKKAAWIGSERDREDDSIDVVVEDCKKQIDGLKTTKKGLELETWSLIFFCYFLSNCFEPILFNQIDKVWGKKYSNSKTPIKKLD